MTDVIIRAILVLACIVAFLTCATILLTVAPLSVFDGSALVIMMTTAAMILLLIACE